MPSADRTHVLLIIDGDESARRRIARLLVQQPLFACEIIQARTGTAGLAAASAQPPDCVLLAATLPDMQMSECLARLGTGRAMPPIVLLTQPADLAQARDALKRGIREHLDKTQLNETAVWRAIAAALSRHDRAHGRGAVAPAPASPPGSTAAARTQAAAARFVSTLSHDMRAPLQCIMGYAELLRLQGPLTAQQDQHVGAMMEAGRSLIDMLDKVRTAAAAEFGGPAPGHPARAQTPPQPAPRTHEGPADLPETAAAPAPLPPPPRRLLVVDDIAVNRDVIGAFLHAAGHQVTLADSGEEAIRLAFEQSFDLILMDVRMPEMDGLEATRRIRALPAPRGDVPILGVTAHAFLEQVDDCRAAGMDGHIAKPVGYAVLMEAIDRAITHVPTRWQPAANTQTAPTPPAPPPGLDRAVLEETLSFLRPDEIASQLLMLRTRKEELIRLLDMQVDAGLLTETAHSLASVAGMFGFTFLSMLARRYEHAMAHDAPDAEPLGRELRTETRAALGTLDAVRREQMMQAA